MREIASEAAGHCIGSEGVNLVMHALQNQLISDGYITSRVLAPEQNLTSGTLKLLLVKGTLNNAHYTKNSDSWAALQTAMPLKSGDTINVHDIEQGLENLQSIPTVNAKMQIKPTSKEGESDVVITRNQSKFWRIGLSVDDSGTEDTGKYQGSGTLYLDGVLGLSDAFYASYGNDLEGKKEYGSKNYIASYSLPIGYFFGGISYSHNDYHQTIAGVNDYTYSGQSDTRNVNLSWVASRSQTQKTTLKMGLNLKNSRNFINDVEVELQRRKTTNLTLGINHTHYISDATLDAGLTFKKGVRWLGAEKAPEEYGGYGTALENIVNFNADLILPFSISNQRFTYHSGIQGQVAIDSQLTPPDRFSIGGRWTVRGFDGELSLSADNGFFIRNDIAWSGPLNLHPYIAIDYGQVFGDSANDLFGTKLLGGAIGLKGGFLGLSYDLFVGAPIYQPSHFRTDSITTGFNLNWNY